MRIAELNDDQKSRIIQALEEDGFSNVQDHGAYISYSKFPRDFELYTLDVGGDYNSDNFMNIYLKETEYIGHLLNDSESNKFAKAKSEFIDQLKIRHSTTLNQKTDLSDDDLAIQSMPGWKLVTEESLQGDDKFFTRAESSKLKHILIKEKSHFALDHGPGNYFMVYEGTPDLILGILLENPENFALTPSLMKVMGDIKLEANDL